MDLTDLLRATEGKTLEFKRSLDSPQGVLRALVAFANTAGGKLLIGVEAGSHAVCGVAEPLALEERLASQNRPHHLRREGADKGTYVRVGSTNRHADAALIAEMRRYALGEGYDEQPLPDLDSEAIDFRVASESFVPVRKFKRGDLTTLRLTTRHQGRSVPSIGRTPRATRSRLIALIERQLVREIGTGPSDPKRRYYLIKAP